LTPDRRTLLALFSLAFGLRILYAVIIGDNPDVVRDTYGLRIAARMVESFAWISTPFAPTAPGYRMLLALAFKLFGVGWWTAVFLNAVLGATTALFVYRIGERLIGRRVGLISALWLGLSVGHMHLASLAMRDVLVTFLLTWLAYALARPFYRMRTAVWVAFLCTLLAHTEPMFLVMLPLLVVFLAWKSTRHRALSAQYVFLFLAALFVFFLPWTTRNLIVRRDGRISMPYVGDQMAAGITPMVLDSLLTTRFSEVLRDPILSVIVSQPAPQKVYVLGEVNTPGRFEFIDDLSMVQAVAMAGGATKGGMTNHAVLIRRQGVAQIVGVEVDLQAVMNGSQMSNDLRLRNYDIIMVPKHPLYSAADFMQVVGEIINVPLDAVFKGWQIANLKENYQFYRTTAPTGQ